MNHMMNLEAFVRVAESGSFIEAARQLGITRSVVSYRVQQLEQLIGAPLFHRSTRHVRLSEVGEAFIRECSHTVYGLESLIENMQAHKQSPRGKMRIQVAPGFAIDYFGALLAQYMAIYPDIQVDIVMDDRINNPILEGFDLAFQIFAPTADTLVERKLFPVQRIFCASASYLAKHPPIQRPADLLDHAVALYDGYPSRYRFNFVRGAREVELNLAAKVRSSSVHLLRDLALHHAGVACLPTLVASRHLVAGELVPVLTDYTLNPYSLRAVYPATQRHSVKLRTLLDFLAEQLPSKPLWDEPLIRKGWLKPPRHMM